VLAVTLTSLHHILQDVAVFFLLTILSPTLWSVLESHEVMHIRLMGKMKFYMHESHIKAGACMYVCMHVIMYVCMYVCIFVFSWYFM
jgi:hypothetical protein